MTQQVTFRNAALDDAYRIIEIYGYYVDRTAITFEWDIPDISEFQDRLVGEFHDCGYKFGRWYDMVWMEKMIGFHPDNPEPVLNYNDIKAELTGNLLTA